MGGSAFSIRGRPLRPIVQGGMGIGVSAHRLAGSVAALGAMGTVSAVDLRRLHPDLMARTHRSRDAKLINASNLEALDREIGKALSLASGRGLVAVNVMRAVSEYSQYVKQACASGAQAIVVGAGLPLDLPALTAAYPNVALIPILSDARGALLVVRKWLRQGRGRLPDAIILEHPGWAGGHLGAASLQDIHDSRFDFERAIPELKRSFRTLSAEAEDIPIIAAGGIDSPAKVRKILDVGATAVQLGTPFAVTLECDAHPVFKQILAEAKPEDIVTFMSVAGLPARAVKTPWLEAYLAKLDVLCNRAAPRKACTLAFDCLAQCGLRDGIARMGQFCIDNQLAAALRGDRQRGLFFRGAGQLPFGSEIRSVAELIGHMLGDSDIDERMI